MSLGQVSQKIHLLLKAMAQGWGEAAEAVLKAAGLGQGLLALHLHFQLSTFAKLIFDDQPSNE